MDTENALQMKKHILCTLLPTLALFLLTPAFAAGQPSSTPDTATGLVSHWKFDEVSGSTAFDASSNGNNLTLFGGASFAGNALRLNGTSGHASARPTTGLNNTSALTITAWVKPTALPPNTISSLVRKGSRPDGRGYSVSFTGNKLGFHRVGVLTTVGDVPVAVDGAFHHVAVTWSAAARGLNLNSAADRNEVQPSGYTNLEVYLNRPTGQDPVPGENDPASHWKFDEASGTTADDFTGPNNLTLSGGASFVSGGQFGNALSINGTTGTANDSNGTTGLNTTSNFTITAWLKPTFIPSSGIATVVRKGDTDAQRGYLLNIVNGDFNLNKVGQDAVQSTVSPPVDGTFHHIAVTWSNSTDQGRFYLDGELAETVTEAGDIAAPVDADILSVGSHPIFGSFFHGLIDDLRIYPRVLSATEIGDLASTANAAPTVSIVTPTNGATVAGSSVTVGADANDDVDVLGVQFKLDGVNLGPVVCAMLFGMDLSSPSGGVPKTPSFTS